MSLVLTQSEIDRIKSSVLPPVEAVNNRKAELKKKSEERLKNWPNTLEALRKKKESFLKDREDAAELVRQQIDIEEAEKRRMDRLEAIRKANDLIYEQTDKMKLLKSQKLYADVIYTRFQQIDKKQEVKESLKVEDAKYHEIILETVKRGEEVEAAKIAKREREVELMKQSRVEQIEEVRKAREEKARLIKEDGLRMKALAEQQLREDIQKQEDKIRRGKETTIKLMAANEQMKIERRERAEEERLKALERDAEVEVIEARKRDLKRLEKERFEKSQLTRQMLIDAAVYQLSLKKNEEDTLMQKQGQEIKDREDKAIQDKQDKADHDWEVTVQSRNAQIARKAHDKAVQKEQDDRMAAKWKRENEEGIKREAEKAAKAKAEQTRIKMIQLEEGRERARRKQEDKMVEIEQERFLQSLASNDDERFVQLCKAEIERNVALGKPVYTLLKALEFTAPGLLAAKTVPIKRRNKNAEEGK